MMLDPQYRSPWNTPAASRATLVGNSIMQSVASSSCCSSAMAVVAVDAGVADPEATEPGVRAAKGWRRASSTTRLGSCAPLSGESGTARHGLDGLGMPPTPAGSHTPGRLRGGRAGRYGSVTGSVDPHPAVGTDDSPGTRRPRRAGGPPPGRDRRPKARARPRHWRRLRSSEDAGRS
jgi:hypothetical protein